MSVKLTGYDFWNTTLKSPQYVAAPMVDMSELSFRMLCRQYNAQLCFSPMIHSQQFLQDSLYRSDNFSTCLDDRPLIIQFCSNNPDDFVNAGKLVSSECDAIDLNLGCPQAIAKKGHYGAFLQDDWDLIHSIVRKASTELPVPITCKMRVFPDVRKSVEYAKMLEDSGCSILTVHGRTREQKGHATGLGSWEVIKEIKANVSIPVIANGNILSFGDVKDCLEYTGADAVMSAEALLHNPALFSGQNPPVWSIIEEYLQYAEKYNTSIRCVRCHLFKILYLCIHKDSNVQQALAEGKTFDDFYAVCKMLKALPKSCQSASKKTVDVDIDEFLTGIHLAISDSGSQSDLELNSNILSFDESKVENLQKSSYSAASTGNLSKELNHCLSLRFDAEDKLKDEDESLFENLPVWLCHSRPRMRDENNQTRGCYSKYFRLLSPQKEPEETEKQFMSKKKLRRERHHERVLAAMKAKRKTQRMRRKQKLAEQSPQQDHIKVKPEDTVKMTKKEKKMLIRERLLKAQGFSPKVCINLGFASEMTTKELTRLSFQLRRLYGSNRQSASPLHLHFCNFSETDDLYGICLKKNDGFSSYVVEMTEKSPEQLFSPEDLVYLSPDSANVLTSLDHNKIYVIGGIVDSNVKKGLSLNHAKELNIKSARLPIAEYLVKASQNPGTMVLTVNQVFDILLKYYETQDWVEALCNNVPHRKGYCAPSHLGEDSAKS